MKTQFGFRPGKSTGDAIGCMTGSAHPGADVVVRFVSGASL